MDHTGGFALFEQLYVLLRVLILIGSDDGFWLPGEVGS